jgi:hypothetical protein
VFTGIIGVDDVRRRKNLEPREVAGNLSPSSSRATGLIFASKESVDQAHDTAVELIDRSGAHVV